MDLHFQNTLGTSLNSLGSFIYVMWQFWRMRIVVKEIYNENVNTALLVMRDLITESHMLEVKNLVALADLRSNIVLVFCYVLEL